MRILNANEIQPYSIPAQVFLLCEGLPVRPDVYFTLSGREVFVPMSSLVLSRARPQGILSAIRKMKEASVGLREKRSPVSVRKLLDYILVLDGNSTIVVLNAVGFNEVPVVIAEG